MYSIVLTDGKIININTAEDVLDKIIAEIVEYKDEARCRNDK